MKNFPVISQMQIGVPQVKLSREDIMKINNKAEGEGMNKLKEAMQRAEATGPGGHEQDGTGPHGAGNGPGKGRGCKDTSATKLKGAMQRANEASPTEGIRKELEKLIAGIKDGSMVDKRMQGKPDGELLAMYLNGILQSAKMHLKDPKSFSKNLKV